MKNIVLIIGFLMVPFFSISQVLYKYVDTMSDKIYFFDSGTYYLDEVNNKGYRLDGRWKINSNSPIFLGFTVKLVGLGNCVEKVEMIILFENGEKIQRTSWNDFNCEGNCYYVFSQKELGMLMTMPISKIRFQNGRNYEQITGQPINPRFFIEINQKAVNGEFSTKTE